ncbi:hypothetical protein TrLO_g1962 [Triparma laevis f. longispina]|uniref:Uncharacterized protein n=1 Tax=Triparma laevis f. longispina TaxID=1714387 RepID=A0A9W7E6U9_9STRA|nr:hypothetical protein TrLO_g1962 [Triparma laevis f. longispina]
MSRDRFIIDAKLQDARSSSTPTELKSLYSIAPRSQGEPRYATIAYVNDKLYPAFKNAISAMRLPANLCGERVNEVLRASMASSRRAPPSASPVSRPTPLR